MHSQLRLAGTILNPNEHNSYSQVYR